MFVRCGVFFLRSRMFVRCGVFFWDRGCFVRCRVFFLRSRMFVRCRVFFWDRACLLGVGYFFWDHECLLGVGFFLRSRMFDRCGVFFEITNVWQVWGIFFWEMWLSRWYSRGMVAGCGLGFPQKKGQIKDLLGSSTRPCEYYWAWVENRLFLKCLFLKDKRTSWLWKWMTTFGYSSIMSSKWNVNYKTRLICKPSQLKTRKRNACTKA